MISNIIQRKIDKAINDNNTKICKQDLQKALKRVLKQNAGSQFNKNKILQSSCLKFIKISDRYLTNLQISPFKFVMLVVRELLLQNYSTNISYDMVIINIHINILKLKFLSIFGQQLSSQFCTKKKKLDKSQQLIKTYERVRHFVKQVQQYQHFDEIRKDYYSNIQVIYLKLAQHFIIIEKYSQSEIYINKTFQSISLQLKVLNQIMYLQAQQQNPDKKVFLLMQKKANLFIKLYYLDVILRYYKGQDIPNEQNDSHWQKYINIMDQYLAIINRQEGINYINQFFVPKKDQIYQNFSDAHTLKQPSDNFVSKFNITTVQGSNKNKQSSSLLTSKVIKLKRSSSTESNKLGNLIKTPDARHSFFIGIDRRNSEIQDCLTFITQNFTNLKTIQHITPNKYDLTSQISHISSQESQIQQQQQKKKSKSIVRSSKRKMGVNIDPQNNLIKAIPQALHSIIEKRRKEQINQQKKIDQKIFGRSSVCSLHFQIQKILGYKDLTKKQSQVEKKQDIQLQKKKRVTLIQRQKSSSLDFFHKTNPFDYQKSKQKNLSKFSFPKISKNTRQKRSKTLDLFVPGMQLSENKKNQGKQQKKKTCQSFKFSKMSSLNNNDSENGQDHSSNYKSKFNSLQKIRKGYSTNDNYQQSIFKTTISKKLIQQIQENKDQKNISNNNQNPNILIRNRKLKLNTISRNSQKKLSLKPTYGQKKSKKLKALKLMTKIKLKYNILKIDQKRVCLNKQSIPIFASLQEKRFVLQKAGQYFPWIIPTYIKKSGQSLVQFIQKKKNRMIKPCIIKLLKKHQAQSYPTSKKIFISNRSIYNEQNQQKQKQQKKKKLISMAFISDENLNKLILKDKLHFQINIISQSNEKISYFDKNQFHSKNSIIQKEIYCNKLIIKNYKDQSLYFCECKCVQLVQSREIIIYLNLYKKRYLNPNLNKNLKNSTHYQEKNQFGIVMRLKKISQESNQQFNFTKIQQIIDKIGKNLIDVKNKNISNNKGVQKMYKELQFSDLFILKFNNQAQIQHLNRIYMLHSKKYFFKHNNTYIQMKVWQYFKNRYIILIKTYPIQLNIKYNHIRKGIFQAGNLITEKNLKGFDNSNQCHNITLPNLKNYTSNVNIDIDHINKVVKFQQQKPQSLRQRQKPTLNIKSLQKSFKEYYFFTSNKSFQSIKNRIHNGFLGFQFIHSYFDMKTHRKKIFVPYYIIQGKKNIVKINLKTGIIQNIKAQLFQSNAFELKNKKKISQESISIIKNNIHSDQYKKKIENQSQSSSNNSIILQQQSQEQYRSRKLIESQKYENQKQCKMSICSNYLKLKTQLNIQKQKQQQGQKQKIKQQLKQNFKYQRIKKQNLNNSFKKQKASFYVIMFYPQIKSYSQLLKQNKINFVNQEQILKNGNKKRFVNRIISSFLSKK